MEVSDEEWEAMTDEERLAAVRDGRFSTNRMRKIMKDGSGELKVAVEEYYEANKPKPLEAIFAQFRTPSLTERLAEISSAGLPEVAMPRAPFIVTQEETHGYESARTLIDRLQTRYTLWKEQLTADLQPAIYAILPNGAVMNALDFEEDGHNGIAITGDIQGLRCLLITHQAGLQLLCVAEPVEQKSERREIGFHTRREPSEPQK
jgi:hypothetical protein